MPGYTLEEVQEELRRRRDEGEEDTTSPAEILGTPTTAPQSADIQAEIARRQKERGPLQTRETEIGKQPKTLGGFLGNVGKSGARQVEALAGAAAHPVETAKGIGGLLIPPVRGLNSQQRAFLDFYKDRYGSLEGLWDTLYEDPVGALADVSMLAGGAGGGLRALPLGARAGKLGSAVSRAGRAVDPLRAAASGLKVAVVTPYKVGKGLSKPTMGAMLGVGAENMDVAQNLTNPSKFKSVMRSQVNELSVAQGAHRGLSKLKELRGEEYRSRLARLPNKKIDLRPIKKRLDELVTKEFRGKIRTEKGEPTVFGAKGEPVAFKEGKRTASLRESAMGRQGQSDISKLYKIVSGWKDDSSLGVDALKRQIDDFSSESGQARAFVQVLKDEVRDTLDRQVLGYKEMTEGYATASDMIKLIEDELSLGGQTGTTVRKLSNALNQNSQYRKTMVEALDVLGDPGLIEQVAGMAFSSWLPRGIMRPLTGGKLLFHDLPRLLAGDPTALFSLPLYALSSPRAVGELLLAVGAAERGLARVGRAIPGKPNALVYRPFTAVDQAREDVDQEDAGGQP